MSHLAAHPRFSGMSRYNCRIRSSTYHLIDALFGHESCTEPTPHTLESYGGFVDPKQVARHYTSDRSAERYVVVRGYIPGIYDRCVYWLTPSLLNL